MPSELPDHYALLNVHPSAGVARIKAAYLRQVFRWHPDRNPSPEAGERTARLNAAWEVLGDPAKRSAYDRQLKLRRSPATSTESARSGATGTARRTRPAQPPPARPTRPAHSSTPDSAAAERLRRAEAASARDAEARRQRNAEYEQRRKDSEHLWQPPSDSGLGWTDRDFVVGHWYRDARHTYRVIDVRDRLVDVYLPDGRVVSQRRDDLWREWWQYVERRQAPARPGRIVRHRYGVGGPR